MLNISASVTITEKDIKHVHKQAAAVSSSQFFMCVTSVRWTEFPHPSQCSLCGLLLNAGSLFYGPYLLPVSLCLRNKKDQEEQKKENTVTKLRQDWHSSPRLGLDTETHYVQAEDEQLAL